VVAEGWRVEDVVRRMCGYNEFNGGGGGTAEVPPVATAPDDEDNEDDEEDNEDDVRAASASAETPWRAGEAEPLPAADDAREVVDVVVLSLILSLPLATPNWRCSFCNSESFC
jgi:hypothetical protein